MNKAEEFIQNFTKNCSNEFCNAKGFYQPWLTPDQARKAVKIAREEMLNDISEWIEENIGEYCDGENIMFTAVHMENIDFFEQERFIKELKQAMNDE